MPYDLFISYSRRDNQQGRVTQLVQRIEADFAAFAGRPLMPFFDVTEAVVPRGRGKPARRHRAGADASTQRATQGPHHPW